MKRIMLLVGILGIVALTGSGWADDYDNCIALHGIPIKLHNITLSDASFTYTQPSGEETTYNDLGIGERKFFCCKKDTPTILRLNYCYGKSVRSTCTESGNGAIADFVCHTHVNWSDYT